MSEEFTVITPEEQQSFFAAPGDIITLIADANITGGDYSLGDVFVPPGTTTVPHIHEGEDEVFYILEGEIEFQLGEETFIAPEGTVVNGLSGEVHAWSNPSENPARMIGITAPAGFEEFLLATGVPVVDPDSPPSPPTDPAIFDLFNGIAAENQVDIQDTLVFSSVQYAVNEDGSPVVPVTILRPGNISGDASATIVLSDGTATAGEDYNNVEIPISFTGQERIKTVEIPLIDDDIPEDNETIVLSLENIVGVETDALLQNTSALTIFDNDSSDSTLNSTTVSDEERDHDHDHDHDHEHDHDHDHDHHHDRDPLDEHHAGEISFDELVITPDEQESLLLDGGILKTTLLTGEETNEQYTLADVTIPPGSSSPSQVNADETEATYVLEGEVTVKDGDKTFVATPGTFIYPSEGETLELVNLTSEPARTLTITTPEDIEDNDSFIGTEDNELIVDLTSLEGSNVQAEFSDVMSHAAFNNIVGLYVINDEQGTVTDPITGSEVAPGQEGYSEAVLGDERRIEFDRDGTPPVEVEGGSLFAPYILANGEQAYFPFIEANADGVEHIRLNEDGSFGFEDLFGGGDSDFNDISFQVDFAVV